MAQAMITKRPESSSQNQYRYITSIPEDKREEANRLINNAEKLRNPDYIHATVNVRDDKEIPAGSTQATYGEYLGEYISKISQQQQDLTKQRTSAESALASLKT